MDPDRLDELAQAHTEFLAAVESLATKIRPFTEAFKQLCEEVERYQTTTLEALEDDFYGGRTK